MDMDMDMDLLGYVLDLVGWSLHIRIAFAWHGLIPGYHSIITLFTII